MDGELAQLFSLRKRSKTSVVRTSADGTVMLIPENAVSSVPVQQVANEGQPARLAAQRAAANLQKEIAFRVERAGLNSPISTSLCSRR